ncbi:ATP-binding cassette subfamily C protein CydD [Phytomonospora endophytica]|uniref:ATP-binding cassette subfamily C protein CydD n=2 Tax=Phytomonospora endophytica TaxID=714109 RepID=A0A841FDB3_9ACTN|nr:ATP-binding cassette subfamily C protein CydD [Phytomonospora endophytica]
MRPVDPRMTRRLPELRRYLALTAVTGAVTAAAIGVQAYALSGVLARAVDAPAVSTLLNGLALVAAAFGVRALLSWAHGRLAARSAAGIKARLRADTLAAAAAHGPRWLRGRRGGETATLVTRGIDGLDAYLVGYLPQLMLGATVPVAVLAMLYFADLASAIIITVTVPLVPIFGILVGWHTKAKTEKQWKLLSRLGGHFLDVVAGLSTLKIAGRAGKQAEAVRDVADRYRGATMATLRVAFLSALVLELVATVSVALVAVPIGLRLQAGDFDLRIAFFVLLLAPEAFLPLRAMGTQFHASQEGLAAMDEALTIVESAEGLPSGGARPAGTFATIGFDDVTVEYPESGVKALDGASFTVRAGERVALIGPSGAGKSTVLSVLLGFVAPTGGRVLVDGVDLATLDVEEWRRRIGWVPQRAHLFAGSVADNIRLGAPDADDARVRAAAASADADFVDDLPDGYGTLLGDRGLGLSAGQSRRLALARAFLRDAPLLLMDEPTASLDGRSEAAVTGATARFTADGSRTALIVAHRPAILDGADRVLRVADGKVAELETEGSAR